MLYEKQIPRSSAEADALGMTRFGWDQRAPDGPWSAFTKTPPLAFIEGHPARDDPSAGDLLRNIPRDWDMELLALVRLYH